METHSDMRQFSVQLPNKITDSDIHAAIVSSPSITASRYDLGLLSQGGGEKLLSRPNQLARRLAVSSLRATPPWANRWHDRATDGWMSSAVQVAATGPNSLSRPKRRHECY